MEYWIGDMQYGDIGYGIREKLKGIRDKGLGIRDTYVI